MIYLDNGATTLHKPECVIDAVVNAMKTQGNASRGAHGATLSASRTVYDARVKIAKFFNFDIPSNVVFTCNSTEAHSDTKGILDLSQFEKICDEKTKVVVVNHISNLTGNVNDIKTISNITHKVGAILIVDGSQSAGTRRVDVKELGIDVYCFTGHKGLYGPQGTGGLLVKEGIEIDAWKRGGSGVKTYEEDQPHEYPTRLEAGTLNSHGIAGLSAAIDFLNDTGIDNIEKKEKELTEYFYNEVTKIDGIKVYGDFSWVDANTSPVGANFSSPLGHAAIVSLNVKDYDSGEVSDALSNDYGIATRPGAHCAPRLHIALGTKHQGAVRFSFSYFTTKEELDTAIIALKEIAS